MKNIKKEFTTLEIVNIVAYINNYFTEEMSNELPLKFRWYLKKNLDAIIPIAKRFDELRDGEVKKIQEKWFTDDNTEIISEPERDANGNVVKDTDGNEIMQELKHLKKEFQADYQKEFDELNLKLRDILLETNEVDVATVDFDDFVDGLSDDTAINFDALNILSFMDKTTDVKEAN